MIPRLRLLALSFLPIPFAAAEAPSLTSVLMCIVESGKEQGVFNSNALKTTDHQ